MKRDLVADHPISEYSSKLIFNQRAKRLDCICDLLSDMFGRVEMKAESSQYVRSLSEWNFRIVPGDLLVMSVMCCYCDLGKKNATAGLYFQQIFFLNIN